MLRPHIVILGAGFGGTYVAKKLLPAVSKGKIDVTVVNKTNYFLFTPLLHEVATGALSPASSAEPLREIFKGSGIRLCQGVVESVNAANRRVHIRGAASDAGKHTLEYDYLVIATGAEANYYGIPGAEQFTLPLKSLADAARIRSKVIDAFEEAVLCEDLEERLRRLSFAVIGCGPTGVEVAAELAELVRGMARRYYDCTNCLPDVCGSAQSARKGNLRGSCRPEEPTIGIVDGAPELLAQFPPKLRAAAARRLLKHGVNLHLGSKVTAVTPKGVVLANNSTVPAATVIWAAGVKPAMPVFEGDMPELVNGRLAVDEFFHAGGNDRVFALGDIAAYDAVSITAVSSVAPRMKDGPIQPSRPVPMLAQAAVQEAKIVAGNIIASINQKKLKSFKYRPKGALVSVGQWFAVGEIFGLQLSGNLAWWLWRTVYLFKFASWKKRIHIAFEWTVNLFYTRDITKLS
ncbi:NAD(P)/FAD-dependent oxidoreductase [Patescibacteria group bacterium]|nr:NAD(P)/FAD-dependent oxidoreductase [Patescibacteria group bacterium]MDE1946292.1 NAD(P)/FAD-dependent oxidoreductase [Patescibacteria group bacterium]MDE2010744.1 NAD(P)/FAD-dependent oxidoreductase [Patescibacteria group bacterium]MDE2232628.1 NAD(P)/FAD-dependent oxidoreductase [Patescibacteria group bacterium]